MFAVAANAGEVAPQLLTVRLCRCVVSGANKEEESWRPPIDGEAHAACGPVGQGVALIGPAGGRPLGTTPAVASRVAHGEGADGEGFPPAIRGVGSPSHDRRGSVVAVKRPRHLVSRRAAAHADVCGHRDRPDGAHGEEEAEQPRQANREAVGSVR